ncbi:MAG: glycosyltransferase [Pseudomonadota bacterium]
MNGPKVFLYVQHLWGVGHVYRATRVARALAKNGMDVHLIWGGTEISGFDFTGLTLHRLPAVRSSDVSFKNLLHANGDEFMDADKASRRDHLLSLFYRIEPDILITEAFPFGRRQMLFELLPLLEAAHETPNKPIIVASIRDIMQEGRSEKRVAESTNLVEQYYDLILVHGDEKLVRIEQTLQGAQSFLDKVRYTGLVAPERALTRADSEVSCDVLVSVGGGAFGQELTQTALQAMAWSKEFPSNWLIVGGSELSPPDFQFLKDNCPKGMRIVKHLPNLVSVMKQAKVSVSHAGYNTVCDILISGCKALLYPYIGDKETEQLRRSRLLADKNLAAMIEPDELTPQHLATSIDALSQRMLATNSLDLAGAQNCANILSEFLKKNR